MDPRGISPVDLQTTLMMLWRNSPSITGHTLKTDINLFFNDNKLLTFQIVRLHSLLHHENNKFVDHWQPKPALVGSSHP